uniref:Pescadillo homolog n=1 Tax=Acrobeloides nanus TaxID=290746 RepID=A0A914DNS5_9BILA
MGRIRKKFQSGTSSIYISRKKALKKLQLTLKDFRRLCILKGIYPREPLHKKKANKGSTENKIYYHVKDVNFLANEPLINKFREYKIFLRRLTRAKAKGQKDHAERLLENKPQFRLDLLVKERYPTFASALRDMDDALCLLFAFAALPRTKAVKGNVVADCRRLTTEFMHYVIESHSLTKTFVSIKGIYYQAEIMGEKITWIVPHERGIGHVTEVDFNVMATFVDFYVAMISFVNFRLYKALGLFYPPKLSNNVDEKNFVFEENDLDEKIYSLARPIARTQTSEPEPTIDTFSESDTQESLAEKMKIAQALRTLFAKCKFFLNREVSKEAMALIIRSCGGTVSWEGCIAKVYDEKNEKITHHVIDRPLDNVDINRAYVQPQWVFDSFNARKLLPTDKYAPGRTLPPHLSPFVEEKIGEYVPLEKIEQLKEDGKDITHLLKPDEDKKKEVKPKRQKTKPETPESGMSVKTGKVFKENLQKKLNQVGQELKLREMMIPKKHRRVYKKIKYGQKRQASEKKKLESKRQNN